MRWHLLVLCAVIVVMNGCKAKFWEDDFEDQLPFITVPIQATPSQGLEALRQLNPALNIPAMATVVGDPLAVPAHLITFRRIDAGSGMAGVIPGEVGRKPTDIWRGYTVARYWLGVTELTRTQWAAIAAAAGRTDAATVTPWLSADPIAAVGGAVGDPRLPAAYLSRDQVESVLADWNRVAAGIARLRLPTPIEWEHACRSGTLHGFAWGNDTVQSAKTFSVVRETRVKEAPAVVALGRQPNALGLWDMQGNLWELVASTGPDAELRGGSWRDNLISARAGNQQRLDRGLAHALTGVRLVLEAP